MTIGKMVNYLYNYNNHIKMLAYGQSPNLKGVFCRIQPECLLVLTIQSMGKHSVLLLTV